MKKIVLVYGIIAGVVAGGVLMASMPFYSNGSLDMSNGAVVGYTSMVIALSLIFFAIRSFRDKQNNGKISFGKALTIGLLITLIASIIYSLAWEVCYNTVAKDFMTTYSEYSLNELKASGATDEIIEHSKAEMTEMTEMYKNPLVRFPMTMLELLPVGILLSLICSLILKKK